MKRKTAGELAEFFAAMPRGRKVMFMGTDFNGENIEYDGSFAEFEGNLYIYMEHGRYIDNLWYLVHHKGTRLDGEL